jgi:hypothetical protein
MVDAVSARGATAPHAAGGRERIHDILMRRLVFR